MPTSSWESNYQRDGKVSVDRVHGHVVKALREKLAGSGKAFKSGAMDLVFETGEAIRLFEVKTEADSQSLYTGIGQLVLHGAALRRKFPEKRISQILVVPASYAPARRARFRQELAIDLVSFVRSDGQVSFDGLDEL